MSTSRTNRKHLRRRGRKSWVWQYVKEKPGEGFVTLLLVASFLDPRFKTFYFTNHADHGIVRDVLEHVLQDLPRFLLMGLFLLLLL